MAEALIKAVDFVHPDPEIDRRGAHKRGDIIVVKPDGWNWGGAELDTSKFEIRTVPDSMLNAGFEGQLMQSAGQIVPRSAKKNPRMSRLIRKVRERQTLKRHRFSIDLDSGDALIDHYTGD